MSKDKSFLSQSSVAEPSRTHESTEIYLPGIIVFLIFMIFAAAVMHGGLWGWLETLRGAPARDQSARFSDATRSFPKLQIQPRVEWQQYHAAEERRLNTYGWIDRTHNIVRIPIDSAIDLVVRDGLPRWGATNPPTSPLELQRQRAGKGKP